MPGELLRVDVGDLTFDVRADGPEDGRPVLLLHGFPETSACWAAVTPLLKSMVIGEWGFQGFFATDGQAPNNLVTGQHYFTSLDQSIGAIISSEEGRPRSSSSAWRRRRTSA